MSEQGSERICPNCGQKIASQEIVDCSNCGRSLPGEYEVRNKAQRVQSWPSFVVFRRALALALISFGAWFVVSSTSAPPTEELYSFAIGIGAIKVVLASPGLATLDHFSHPEGGLQDRKIHHFQDVKAGTHIVTVWRAGDESTRKSRNVTVETGKTTEVKMP